jgi:exopolysaccharide biosynthesis polyprenyl glycosylphosphotransferase
VSVVRTAHGRTPKAGRPHIRPITEKCAVAARNSLIFRNAVLPVCDGSALTTAVVLVIPEWQAIGFILAVLFTLNVSGAQRLRLCLRVSDEIPRLAAFVALPAVLFLPWAHPAIRVAVLSLVAVGLLLTVRAGLYAALRACHRHGLLTEPALIVGTGQTGIEVGKVLTEHPDLGLRPVGLIGSRPQKPASPLPVLGGLSEIAPVVEECGVRSVIVCFTDRMDADLVTVLRANAPLPADVYVVPRMYELAAAIPAGSRDDVWGIPIIPMRPSGPRWAGQVAKRLFDLIVGTLLLVVSAPLMLTLLIVVRLGCGRPVFFRQDRVTRGGDLMKITKFRTITARDPDAQWTVSPQECTKLGRWLRATHLDELPQLVNVIRGQMSLVGPRPERPHFTSQFSQDIPRYADRHRVATGMTGWAQVHGLSGDTSIPERVRFDNYYIEHWSLWLDVTILVRTLAQPLTGALDGAGQHPDARANGHDAGANGHTGSPGTLPGRAAK